MRRGWIYAHEAQALLPYSVQTAFSPRELEGESSGIPAPGEKQLCCGQGASPELMGAHPRRRLSQLVLFHTTNSRTIAYEAPTQFKVNIVSSYAENPQRMKLEDISTKTLQEQLPTSFYFLRIKEK